MKRVFLSVALAIGASAFAQPVNATSCGIGCSFTENTADFLTNPGAAPNPTPVATSPVYYPTLYDSVSGQYRSPYENGSPANTQGPGYGTNPYSSVEAGGSATFNFANSNALSILWGSPDQYNALQFWTGLNGTGQLLYTISGSLLIQTYGHDRVDVATTSIFNSVVLLSTQNAFEFAGLSACSAPTGASCAPPVSQTPLPAALPLLAGGLGAFGLFGWRRQRRRAATA